MSKRFGRKQKQKLREQLATTEDLLQQSAASHNNCIAELANLRQLAEMVERVNPDFPSLKEARKIDNDIWRVSPKIHIQQMHYPECGAKPTAEIMKYVDLYQLEAELRNDPIFPMTVEFSTTVDNPYLGTKEARLRISKKALEIISIEDVALKIAAYLKPQFELLR